jgi:catechol-2,3-dioxygenase
MGIAKIGYAGFNTLDVEAMLAYYTNVLGMGLVDRESNGTTYLRNAADHHTIVLYPSQEHGLRHIGLQIDQQQTLMEVATHLRKQNVAVEVQTDAQPGISRQLEFADPDGNILHLYARMEEAIPHPSANGIAIEKLGHIALTSHNVQRLTDFYQRVLGFRVSDWIEDFFVFLRCGFDHHTLNFFRSKRHKMHHIAFQLKDWPSIQQACDFLFQCRIPLLWGPGRHGPGHNIFTYHANPDQQIVELFAELDLMLDEDLGWFEPRPWHETFPQRPKIWENKLETMNHWGTEPSPAFQVMTD